MLQKDIPESRVGKTLSQKTTQHVILVVLAMLFTFPLFTPTFWFEEPDSGDFGLGLIYRLNPETVAGGFAFEDTIKAQSEI
jgi:hypothetical protein